MSIEFPLYSKLTPHSSQFWIALQTFPPPQGYCNTILHCMLAISENYEATYYGSNYLPGICWSTPFE